MFDKIKNSLGSNNNSRQQQARNFDVSNKPFTEALILRASKYQDEAKQDLIKILGRIRPITQQDNTLNEFASSCAITIARNITSMAMDNIDHEKVFLPYTPLPKYAGLAVAYSIFLLVGIHGELEAEGIKTDSKEMMIDIANLHYMSHPDKERAENAMDGIHMFQFLVKSGGKNIEDWHDNLMKLIPLYVLQWTTEDQQLKQQDFIPLFGSMLNNLFSTME